MIAALARCRRRLIGRVPVCLGQIEQVSAVFGVADALGVFGELGRAFAVFAGAALLLGVIRTWLNGANDAIDPMRKFQSYGLQD